MPIPEITNHPWHITRKYGFAVNEEQSLNRCLTAFGRFGWNNDKTESFAFTEVGLTFAGGLGANGAMWHRRYDRAGIAMVSNAISKDHQTYLAEGGYGFLLGDGALDYAREKHCGDLLHGPPVAGHLHCARPAIHQQSRIQPRSRPVLVPSFRLHLEF